MPAQPWPEEIISTAGIEPVRDRGSREPWPPAQRTGQRVILAARRWESSCGPGGTPSS
ncbi:MAG: hypothetical protein ACLPYB_02775 [Desulfobaccales bacterium]